MNLVHLLLNLSGLLLWLKWRDRGPERIVPKISLVATLRTASARQPRIWFLLGLLLLLSARPFLYWSLGSALSWTPGISFGVVSLPFRSDYFGRMVLFSFASFGVALGIYYSCLLLLSIIADEHSEMDPTQSLVRVQLGKLDALPAALKLVIPWLATFLLWLSASKPLVALGMLPPPKSIVHLLEQSAVVGFGIYLAWAYLVVGVLVLYLLNSYIYFGAWPFWNFIDSSGRRMLKWISWMPLQIGKIDFSPIIAAILVFLIFRISAIGLVWLYQRLPI